MDNQQIAGTLEEIGDLLEIDGANRFRVLAYKKAAETLRGLGRDIKDIYKENPDELENLPGIGQDLRSKIEEMLQTGHCQYHRELVKKFGHGLLDILKIRGIGPKKVALFYHELGIDNLEKLKAAALAKKLSKLPRMGEKSELEILQAMEEHSKYSRRMLLSEALPLAEEIIDYLKRLKTIAQIQYAGSLRRRKETVGDLDILVAPKNIKDAGAIIEFFQKFPKVSNIVANGPTKCSVIMANGVQADLRVVETKSFGAALHYFTGSKDHNVEIRTIAIKANKKINEYGIHDLVKQKDGTIIEKFIVGDTEEKFYKAVGLEYIPPTLRESRGEFQAVIDRNLPELVELEDLRGDLNVNSNYGSGKATLSDIFKTYEKAGHQYLAIADQFTCTEHPTDFNNHQLEEQLTEINKLATKFPKLKIFRSIKLSIKKDGSLELPDAKLLKQIDFITVRINSDFALPEVIQTKRLLLGLNAHPKIKQLSAPNARLLNERTPLAINIEKIILACVQQKIILEVNSNPHRLDLFDNQIKLAINKDANLSINSDLIQLTDLDNLKYGLWTAQRGWAEKKNILNAQPLNRLTELLT